MSYNKCKNELSYLEGEKVTLFLVTEESITGIVRFVGKQYVDIIKREGEYEYQFAVFKMHIVKVLTGISEVK